MLKAKLACGLAVALGVALLAGCGRESTPTPTPVGTGFIYTFVGDAPTCDVLSLQSRFAEFTMKKDNGDVATIFSESTGTFTLIKVNFAALRDFSTILHLTSVPEGTYGTANFKLSLPQITVFNPLLTPPVEPLTSEFLSATPEVSIQPALTVAKDKVNAVRVDFDLPRSVQVDGLGQVTGKISPVLKVTPVVADAEGFGEFDNLVGFVRTVTNFSSNSKFIGSFNMQMLAGTGLGITVNVTNDTQLSGAASLNALETGRFAEVIGFVDVDGNLVATSVEFQDRAVVEEQKIAFLGFVVSVTKDAEGRVTQFDFYVREEEPDVNFEVPLNSVVKVSVGDTTNFQVSARPVNFAGLPFDATSVAPGQELIVHGRYTIVSDGPETVEASSVYLKLQTAQGNLSSLAKVESDGKSGAFWFAPCTSISQGAPILVFTNSDTIFLNVFGLSELSTQQTLLARGLPFFVAQATTINGVSVPAGTMVMTARQIHQVQ